MIDHKKTEFLRNKIQAEKESVTTETSQPTSTASLSFLLRFIAIYFALYGTQWIALSHFAVNPFTMLESFIIYLTIIGLFRKI